MNISYNVCAVQCSALGEGPMHRGYMISVLGNGITSTLAGGGGGGGIS